jgi:5-methylcytosine-specific restriction endonuclease McrA
MAVIGLGLRSTAKLLGLRTPQQVASAWTVRGIKRIIPAEGSWDLYARRRQSIGMKARELGELWMSEYNPKFPDWSSIWRQESARRKAAAKYSAMSEDERKARNQKLQYNRMASPEQAAKYKEKGRKWREANKAARRDYDRKWREQNPERYKELTSRARKKRSAKPEVRIVSNFRKRLREIMSDARNGGKQSTLKLIGCSSSALAAHLESQFKRGMTWSNYGTHWHVDHIIPCAAFDHTKPEQVRQCWHFTNLRPLEAKANMAKGAKIQAPQLQLLLTH